MTRRFLALAWLVAVVAAAFLVGREIGRRDLGVARTISPVAVQGARVAPAPPPLPAGSPERPDHVVLCLGDGLGIAQLAAGRLRAYGPEGRLTLEQLPVAGLVVTHALDDLVTFSDAAGTALASGSKTVNGRVGTDARGAALASVAERLRAAGGAVGLVTTSRITDATPAAYGAHVARRRDESRIAEQMIASRFELLLGGGRKFFLPSGSPGSARDDARDLRAEARAAGYHVVDDPGELAAAPLPVLGLFADNQLPLERPRPTLEAMARFALDRLAATGRPFFLLLEDEGIDTAGHAADLEALSETLLRFDAAVAAAVEFAARDGRTLVVVTGDHASGGPAIVRARGKKRPEILEVAWLGDLHTGEPVPLFAYGPGAGRFAGLHDNSGIGRAIAASLGLDGGPPGGG